MSVGVGRLGRGSSISESKRRHRPSSHASTMTWSWCHPSTKYPANPTRERAGTPCARKGGHAEQGVVTAATLHPAGHLPRSIQRPRMPPLVGGQDPVDPAGVHLLPRDLGQLVTRGSIVDDHVPRDSGELSRFDRQRHHQGGVLSGVRKWRVLGVVHHRRRACTPRPLSAPEQHRHNLRLTRDQIRAQAPVSAPQQAPTQDAVS